MTSNYLRDPILVQGPIHMYFVVRYNQERTLGGGGMGWGFSVRKSQKVGPDSLLYIIHTPKISVVEKNKVGRRSSQNPLTVR